MSETPHRRHRFVLDLEADSLDEVSTTLEQIVTSIALGDIDGDSFRTSGGVHSGYTIAVSTDQDQTHARYFELVTSWLAERKTAGA